MRLVRFRPLFHLLGQTAPRQALFSLPLALLLLLATPGDQTMTLDLLDHLRRWVAVAFGLAYLTISLPLATWFFWRRKPGPVHYYLGNHGWGPGNSLWPAWGLQAGLGILPWLGLIWWALS